MPLGPLDFLGSLETVVDIVAKQHERTPKLLDYLPGIFYEEGDKKRSPLWALLLVMEENFKSVSDIIDNIDMYFDVSSAPVRLLQDDPDFLAWLGSWVALVPEEDWTEEKKRYVVHQAPHLYKYRGTATGLRYLINLFFEIDVEIKEWVWPQGMIVEHSNTVGVDTYLSEQPDLNRCFVIIWKPDKNESGSKLETKIKNIRALIDREKPAHTKCFFHVKRT